MANKKYYWLKLKEDFFRQKEIKKLRKIAGGDTYTVIYLKMLLIAMNNDNKIYFEGIEDDFSDELALELDEDSDNVKMTLAFLQSQKLIEMVNEDEFLLPYCKDIVGNDKTSTERVRKHRLKKKEEQKKLECNVSCNGSNVSCNENETLEKEKEKDIEKDIEQQQEEKEYVVVVDKIKDYFQLNEKDVKKVANTYLATFKEIEYLIEKLDLVKSTPKVENLVGFLIKAIEEDYPPAITRTNTSMDKGKKFIPRVNTRFHNINQTFNKYDPDELEKILQESQKGKFN